MILQFALINSYSIKDKFCGEDNCFSLLNLTKSASEADIKRSFRELSKVHHPDKNPASAQHYTKIIQAYEVLSKPETRSAYIDYLNNPHRSELYYHYQYYNKVYHPQSNPYIVVSFAIFSLSLIQFLARIGMYKNAIHRVTETTHFKNVINERVRNGEDRDQAVSDALKQVNITGAWSYPKITDIWIVALILFLYRNLVFKPFFYLKWKHCYERGSQPVRRWDAEYKTRTLLGIHEGKWEAMTNKDELVERELWIPENMREFQAEQQRLHEEYLAQHSNKVKMMKRYMKKYQ